MPFKFTQQGQETGSQDLPLSVDGPPSCSFMGPPLGPAGVVSQGTVLGPMGVWAGPEHR